MTKQLGIPKHSGAERGLPQDRTRNDSLPDNYGAGRTSNQGDDLPDDPSQGKQDNSFCCPPGASLPLGPALFRVMRAMIFDQPPSPEMDALPLAQLRLLWTIFYRSHATMKDLGERLGVSQSTVTQLADRLVKRGLIERHPDPDDRRIVRLRISPTGGQMLMAAKRHEHEIMQSVWEALTPAEQVDVVRGLEILAHTAEAVRAAQGRPLPPLPDFHEHSAFRQPADTDASQPVVDLMTRRVRGKSL